MPTTAEFIKVVSVIFQYGILLLLFRFVLRIVRYMWQDVRKIQDSLKVRETSQKEAVLAVVDSAEEGLRGRRFAFSEEISIGRGAENDIVIPDTYVSHHHAVIALHNNLYIIEDLGSVNHTYVNDQILQGRAYLKAGDLIRIGLVTLRFER